MLALSLALTQPQPTSAAAPPPTGHTADSTVITADITTQTVDET